MVVRFFAAPEPFEHPFLDPDTLPYFPGRGYLFWNEKVLPPLAFLLGV